ncbi:MAG: hypothetical protein A4E23_01090 [Methanomethylovorans sp. PtaU1.Bin073]|nr:MAG: hypothetical protein A4E23_01090 [Methanomethylovorans sp. PtaU1.Bin073]
MPMIDTSFISLSIPSRRPELLLRYLLRLSIGLEFNLPLIISLNLLYRFLKNWTNSIYSPTHVELSVMSIKTSTGFSEVLNLTAELFGATVLGMI